MSPIRNKHTKHFFFNCRKELGKQGAQRANKGMKAVPLVTPLWKDKKTNAPSLSGGGLHTEVKHNSESHDDLSP